MEITASVPHSTGTAPTASLQAQAQTRQGDGQKHSPDYEQLKDEKAVLNAAREFAQAAELPARSSIAASAVAPAAVSSAGSDTAGIPVTDSQRTPNWSSFSASAKGYTMAERAINLYRSVYEMRV